MLWNVQEVQYQSGAAAFSLWSTGDPSLLTQQIDWGSQDLASKIAAALFGDAVMAMLLAPSGFYPSSNG